MEAAAGRRTDAGTTLGAPDAAAPLFGRRFDSPSGKPVSPLPCSGKSTNAGSSCGFPSRRAPAASSISAPNASRRCGFPVCCLPAPRCLPSWRAEAAWALPSRLRSPRSFGGFLSGGLRTARVAAPVLDHIRIVELTGFIEEMDLRRSGARFVLRVASAEGLDPAATPVARPAHARHGRRRLRPAISSSLKARLLPPAHAVLPGGYDFARDAYFARLGAVGNVLGRIETMPAPDPPDLALRMFAAIDRGRNALEARVDRIVGGEAGAVAAAMVTGKRDLLDDVTMDTIREAGIFHIITISGVQMTLVAGIFFWGLRRLLAMSRTLALHYPIKKWAAGLAMAGAVAYDIATGSRVGTERALIMTLVLLGAVLFERQALSMRNLAVAALAVIVARAGGVARRQFPALLRGGRRSRRGL